MANDSEIKETESVEGPHKITSLPTRIRRSLHMFAFILQGLLYTFYGPVTGMVTWKSIQPSPLEPSIKNPSPFETHGMFLIICNVAFGILLICFPVLAFVIVDAEASGSTEYLDSTWFNLLSALTLYAVIAAPTSLECVVNVPADRLWIGYVALAVILFAVIFIGFFEYLIILYRYVNAKRAARAKKREETIKSKSDGEKADEIDSEEEAEAKKKDPEETANANKTGREEAPIVSNTNSEKVAKSEKDKKKV